LAFFDDSPNGELIPFPQVLDFFSSGISNGPLSFAFTSAYPLDDFRSYLHSFPSNYLFWAVIYLCCQPWYSLFVFHAALSRVLADFLPPFIIANFFDAPPVPDEFNLFCYDNTIDYRPRIPSRSSSPVRDQFRTAAPFVDTLLAVVRIQLGPGFAFLLSAIVDFDATFPVTGCPPPLVYDASRDDSAVLSELLAAATESEKTLATLSYLAVFGCGSAALPLPCEPAGTDVARVLRCSAASEEPIRSILRHFPRPLFSEDVFLPIEWVTLFRSLADWFGPDDVRASLRSCAPLHIAKCFARVSSNGALHHCEYDASSVVLQLGSILQDEVSLGVQSMLMSCAITLSGSELAGGCFVPHRAVLLPSAPQRPVSESAVIDFPISVRRGVTVGDGVAVCRECRVGCGSILRPRSFLSKRVRVGKGCVVTSGSVVPAGTIVPTGFTYRSATVELCRKLPRLITRTRTGFVRRECGFVDLGTVLRVCPELLWGYIELMRPFPKELGRQLGRNCAIDLGLDPQRLFDVFHMHALSVHSSSGARRVGSHQWRTCSASLRGWPSEAWRSSWRPATRTSTSSYSSTCP
jgi:carbonic anhydrase/acetyltransferase-like protein (isoleucine patch superfamily)